MKSFYRSLRRVLKPGVMKLRKLSATMLRRSIPWLPAAQVPPDPASVRQIVVISKMGIGNFILFMPVLRHLRSAYTRAEIVLLIVRRGSGGAGLLPPGTVDRVIEFDAGTNDIKIWALWRFFRRNSLRPDMAVVRWTGDPLIASMIALLRPRYRVGHVSGAGFLGKNDALFNISVPITEGRHETDLNLDLVRALRIPIQDTCLAIHVSEAARQRADLFLAEVLGEGRPFVAIQVGTSNLQPWKRWSMERWSLLLQELMSEGYSVVLLGSEEERALLEAFRVHEGGSTGPICVNAASRLSLEEAAAVVIRSRLLLCADTSLMHVAAATGTPQVVFWGPTQYERTHPLSEKCVLLRKPCRCTGSLFDREVVRSIWACDQPCLDTSVEEAMAAIRPLLSPAPGASRPVPPVDRRPEETACPLCGGNQSRLLFKLDFSKWRRGGTAYLRRCGSCELLFSWPRPTPAELSSFYGPDYYIFHRDEAETFRRVISIYARTARIVEGIVRERRSLDIGCAAGHFPALMRTLGWDTKGVEISQTAAAHAWERWGVPTFKGTIEEFCDRGERFPLVTAIDVLEHVPDPNSFMRAIARVCEPRAFLVLDTPNGGTFHFRAFGATWRGFNPFHIQLFSPSSIRLLLESHGFEVVKLFSYNNTYPKAEPPAFPFAHSRNGSVLSSAAKLAAHFPSYPTSEDAKSPLAERCQGENLVVIAHHRSDR